MRRLLHDRYMVTGNDCARDLATGRDIPSSALPDTLGRDGPTTDVPPALVPVLDALDHGREGHPQRVTLTPADAPQATSLLDTLAASAQRKGYVPIAQPLLRSAIKRLGADLADRAVLLLDAEDVGPSAAAALLELASMNARPHMLVTLRRRRRTSVVREARHRFGHMTRTALASVAVHPEVVRLRARAARAVELVLAGRHAAAERLLRDVVSCLERRNAYAEAAAIATDLGWLLLDRGKVDGADACGGEAARLGELDQQASGTYQGRLLQAWARLDALRVTDAEAIARAVLAVTSEPALRACATGTLARCLLEQGRRRELGVLDLTFAGCERLNPRWRAMLLDVASAALIETDRLFDAGRRIRSVLDDWRDDANPLATAVVLTAQLRVVVATGDLVVAGDALQRAVSAAKRARAPLQALRAQAAWCAGVARGGAVATSGVIRRRAERFVRVAPPAVMRQLKASADPVPAAARVGIGEAGIAARMIALAQAETDREAIDEVLGFVLTELDAARVEVVSADAGPPSVLGSAGSGRGAPVAVRVLESGIAIGFEGGVDVGVPVRLNSRLVAALTARWPAGREYRADRQAILDCAAAVLAGRIDGVHQRAREDAAATIEIPELLGVSAATAELRKMVLRAARAPFSVLIEGESGVGKELVARAIHQASARRERRFCDVNCAALPDELFEAELFGHTRGAFTGAVADRAGLFEEASGGTLFLDEVADLTLRAQAKLLRAVQQQEIRRVGESFGRCVDVRFVAAANRHMGGEVEAGRFRADLLYRLDVIHIRIPPLRERPEDVPVIARRVWDHAAARVGSHAKLGTAALAALVHYSWPGNVRELQNVLAALAVSAPSRGLVRPGLLPPVMSTATGVRAVHLAAARDQFERRFIEIALARAGGNRSRAARAIGLSRQGLLKSMARLGLRQRREQPGV